jgi:hypothetical protein
MKNFMATYIGTRSSTQRTQWDALGEAERKARQSKGMAAWGEWVTRNSGAIVEMGGPLGKTKRVSPRGIEDTKNDLVAYIIVRAESHEDAAKLFTDHPHFMIFPGDSVEIMECLPMPQP